VFEHIGQGLDAPARQATSIAVLLLFALVLILIIGPLLVISLKGPGQVVADMLAASALVIALGSLHASRATLVVAAFLAILNLVFAIAWLIGDLAWAELPYRATSIAFLIVAAVETALTVFRRDRVTMNKLVGALCLYLMLAAIFAYLYATLELVLPGSLEGLPPGERSDLGWRYIYFSFVTLTTLGYGDVLPTHLYVQSVVVIESVSGQFYLAVLIAGLVGSYLNERGSHDASDSSTSNGNRQ
jgi:hypothetical protein